MSDFQEIPADIQKAIVQKLEERGAKMPCPRCGNNDFTLLGGYFAHVIQSDLMNLQLTGAPVPTIVTACKKCGFLSEHAIGALDLFNTIQKSNE